MENENDISKDKLLCKSLFKHEYQQKKGTSEKTWGR